MWFKKKKKKSAATVISLKDTCVPLKSNEKKEKNIIKFKLDLKI